MKRTEQDISKFIELVTREHKDYWQEKMADQKRYRDAYQTTFWKDQAFSNDMIRIETADAFVLIEGFIASLFSKNPSVVVGEDLAASGGDATLAQAAANRFLYGQREQLENASRLALIYDFAGLKLTAVETESVLDRASIMAVPCWEVIVDRDASCEKDQRFVGHCYYMNMIEAKRRFGNKKFSPVPKQDYFENYNNRSDLTKTNIDLPEDYLYVEVVELYDLLHDEVYFWSPNFEEGHKLIERSVIPIRTYDDLPLPNITTLYYTRSPSKPMEGSSAIGRVYDQIYEKNILRTFAANAVRRDSRQYLYKEGILDEEQLSKITAGIDGAMIAVDHDSLDGIIRPVENTPLSTNFTSYQALIENDLQRGSVLAPFARGEVTRATATEVTALAQYSASEIGKMSREKDGVLERIINIYLRLMDLLVEDEETAVLEVEGAGRVITRTDFDGKLRIHALDQGSTPLSYAQKKADLTMLVPTLQQLGVPPATLLEELARVYELSDEFVKAAEQQAQAMAQQPAMPGAAPAVDGAPDTAAMMGEMPEGVL